MNIKEADPMAIKDQLRHTDFETTQDYYIGSDIEHQREQVEKLALEGLTRRHDFLIRKTGK
jgi:hypothetical protein